MIDTNYLHELSSKSDNIYSHEYFDNFPIEKKIIIVPSGCWTAAADAYTDPVSLDPISDSSARFDRVINEIGKSLYHSDVTFYQFGFPDPNLDTGIKNIYNALRQHNVQAIVYINAPGGLEAFIDPHGLVGLPETIEKIKQDYPILNKDADFFSDKAINSTGYKEDYWNKSGYKLKSYFPILGQIKSEITAPPLFIKRLKSGKLEEQFFAISPSQRKAYDEHIHKEFLKTVALSRNNYDNDKACGLPMRPMVPASMFWRADGGVFESFLHMAAGMAQAKGVAFVYYIPPHLNVTDAEYESGFKPFFVDRVAAILSKYPNAYLIDHSRIAGFSTCDLAHIKHEAHKPLVENALPFKPFTANYAPGYVFNMVGKIKQSRTLLADLEQIGIIKLDGDPKTPSEFEVPIKRSQANITNFLPCSQYQSLFEIVLMPNRYHRSLPVGSVEPQPMELNDLCVTSY